MFGGNRLLFVALGLVATVTAVIGWRTWPTLPVQARFEYSDPRNADYRPGGGKCDQAALAKILDAKVRLGQAADCQEQAEEYRQNSDDLIQQTRSANAAQAQASIANQQLWIGWWQTLGGFLTLAAAIGAAIYARAAAKHTRDGNEIARQNSAPYFQIHSHMCLINPNTNDRGRQACLIVDATNEGQTHALNFFVACEVEVAGLLPRTTLSLFDDCDRLVNILPRGQGVFRFGETQLLFTSDEIENANGAEATAWLTLSYFNGYGDQISESRTYRAKIRSNREGVGEAAIQVGNAEFRWHA